MTSLEVGEVSLVIGIFTRFLVRSKLSGVVDAELASLFLAEGAFAGIWTLPALADQLGHLTEAQALVFDLLSYPCAGWLICERDNNSRDSTDCLRRSRRQKEASLARSHLAELIQEGSHTRSNVRPQQTFGCLLYFRFAGGVATAFA